MSFFKYIQSEIKMLLLLALVGVVVAVGAVLTLRGLSSAPVEPTPLAVQQTPPSPAPQLQTEVLDAANWQTYRNDEFGFEVKYPSHWKLEEGYDGKRYSGEDGFFQFQEVEEFAEGIDEISKYEAYFDEPYGSKPVIENLKIEDQEARLILPSSDQSEDMKNRAGLIIHYPKPVFIQGTRYPYLGLLVDADHIRQILAAFRFAE